MSILQSLCLPVLLTILIEFPIIYLLLKKPNPLNIIAINVLTNLVLNGINTIIPSTYQVVYIVLMEGLIIPITEAGFYMLTDMAKQSKAKIILVTYIANIVSFTLGRLLLTKFMG